MIDALTQYDFLWRAGVAGLVVGVIAPMIGMFLVVRRYSLMADTLSHVSLAGVAIGLLTGIHPIIMATIASIAGALGIDLLRTRRNIGGESVLALFLSGSLALAVVLISIANGFNAGILSYFFGSIGTVSQSDLYWIVALGIVVAGSVVLLYKELFLTSFHTDIAKSQGIATGFFNTLLIIFAAITVSLSMRIVGALLIGALMVIPVISAMRYGYSFKKTLLTAIAFSLISVVVGLITSYQYDLASGGTIVLIALLLFLISLLLTRRHAH